MNNHELKKKVWGQYNFYFNSTFIQQECIELIKNDTKAIYNVIEDFYTNKHFVLNAIQRILKKIIIFKYSIKILSSTTVFNVDNNEKCFLSTK